MAKSKDSQSLHKFVKFLRYLGVTAFVGFLLVLFTGVGLYSYVAKDLPKLDKIEDYRPPVMAEVFDDSGKKIGEFWTEARILTPPIDQIPKHLIEAFVASEDDRFFKHSGVDPLGIIRAFWSNMQAGEVVQGASTITQQIVKHLLLTPERTYTRKIKEAILATRIEHNLTKDQILYIYINQIFFGNHAYGVTAAARNYFHKTLDQLELTEMAMIAGLAKAPSRFNPIINPVRASERTNYVLERMKEEKFITKEEYNKALNHSLKIFKAGTDKEFNAKYAPWFVEHVRRDLQPTSGRYRLYTSGWKIYTTANLKMNQDAQASIIKGLEPFSKIFGYRGPAQHLNDQVAIDSFIKDAHIALLDEKEKVNYHGDPLFKIAMQTPLDLSPQRIYEAVVTGVTGKELKIQVGTYEGNIAVQDFAWTRVAANKAKPWQPSVGDVIEVQLKQAGKDGSSLPNQFTLVQSPGPQAALFSYEPFTGAIKAIIGGQDYQKSEFNRATQALRQPGSSIKPLVYAAALDKGYTPGTIIMDSPISYEESPGNFWSPKNYGGKYYGPTAFRHALVNSRNVVTVRIIMDIGTHYVTAFMRKLGIKTPIYKYYSMALGANEITLEELASAYGTFVTGGIKPDIHFITKIIDQKNNVVEEYQAPKSNYLISYQLLDTKKPEENKDSAEKKTAPPTTEEKVKKGDQPQSSRFKSWDEMEYNEVLWLSGQQKIKEDDLVLSEYEKKILYGNYIPEGYTISPKTAVTMVNILRDVVRAGTGQRALALNKPVCGKTGTTNRETDAWFIGFTPDLLTGVWVGFDAKTQSLGKGRTGGNTALPIWLSYMQDATQSYATKDFTVPKWVDLSIYEAPIQAIGAAGDAELGDIGVGTGVGASHSAGSGGGAEFFTRDLE